ncbi:hypothetical protein HHI36_013205 [Cryptolaemus montrouzieri]|uniref:Uncharacterized protein n=1 Tax=Cryptolaemus montrouzieri TaxID=559131 RepID=A0ABD2NH42_9CUCU
MITENVLKIADRLNLNLSKEDISCYKIGEEAIKHIKVSISNFDIKNSIMEAKKKVLIKAADFGSQEEKIIYINHDITITKQLILKKARELK